MYVWYGRRKPAYFTFNSHLTEAKLRTILHCLPSTINNRKIITSHICLLVLNYLSLFAFYSSAETWYHFFKRYVHVVFALRHVMFSNDYLNAPYDLYMWRLLEEHEACAGFPVNNLKSIFTAGADELELTSAVEPLQTKTSVLKASMPNFVPKYILANNCSFNSWFTASSKGMSYIKRTSHALAQF